jgi:hypothetical protein
MASTGDLPHLLQYKYLSLSKRIMAYLLLNHSANVSGGLYSFFKVQSYANMRFAIAAGLVENGFPILSPLSDK